MTREQENYQRIKLILNQNIEKLEELRREKKTDEYDTAVWALEIVAGEIRKVIE